MKLKVLRHFRYDTPPPNKSVAVTVADCKYASLTVAATIKSVAVTVEATIKSVAVTVAATVKSVAVTVAATVKSVAVTVSCYSQKCRSDCKLLQSKVSQ